MASKDGAVFVSHTNVTRVPIVDKVEFVAGSRLAPRVFLRVLRFLSLHKNQYCKFKFDLETANEEPLRGMCHCQFQFISFISDADINALAYAK